MLRFVLLFLFAGCSLSLWSIETRGHWHALAHTAGEIAIRRKAKHLDYSRALELARCTSIRQKGNGETPVCKWEPSSAFFGAPTILLLICYRSISVKQPYNAFHRSSVTNWVCCLRAASCDESLGVNVVIACCFDHGHMRTSPPPPPTCAVLFFKRVRNFSWRMRLHPWKSIATREIDPKPPFAPFLASYQYCAPPKNNTSYCATPTNNIVLLLNKSITSLSSLSSQLYQYSCSSSCCFFQQVWHER